MFPTLCRFLEANHRLSEATKKKTSDEPPCRRVPEFRSFFDECLVVGLRALEYFDLCNIGLEDVSETWANCQSTCQHTDSAIFSMEDLAPLVSSTGDMLTMSFVERMCGIVYKELLVGRKEPLFKQATHDIIIQNENMY